MEKSIYDYFHFALNFKHSIESLWNEENWFDKVINHPTRYYKEFNIKKSNGTSRIIKSPRNRLMFVQKKIKKFLDKNYISNQYSHGFIKNKSIKSNANVHLNKRYVLTFDIQDYFSSITQHNVYLALLKLLKNELNRTSFKDYKLSLNTSYPDKKLIWIISMLTTTIVEPGGKRVLPTGSPTSPILSNIVFKPHDIYLSKLARKYNCSYSRYADDITFSSNNESDASIRALFLASKEYLTRIGFMVNPDKTRLMPWYMHQTVNSLTVNNKSVNVPKTYKKQIELKINLIKRYKVKDKIPLGLIYTLNKKGFKVSEKNFLSFVMKIKGQIDFILFIQPDSKSYLRHRDFIRDYLIKYPFHTNNLKDNLGPDTAAKSWDFF